MVHFIVLCFVAGCLFLFPWLRDHMEFTAGFGLGMLLVSVWFRVEHGYWPLD